MLIGYYNPSVYVTYLSAMCAVFGMYMAAEGNFNLAFLLFAIGTICDFFDGKIARSLERTEEEKLFGVQIDSICDIINNNVFPAVFFYLYGFRDPFSVIILLNFVVCGVIRLAYYNVIEMRDMSTHSDGFIGVPTTAIIILMILLHFVKIWLGDFPQLLVQLSMLALGISFILNIKVPKMGMKSFALLFISGVICFLKLFAVI